MAPALSIIVPVYNAEKYLCKCIDSILEQTFADFELILVDDGSRDASGAICDRYAARDGRVKVIHKENGGISSARNAGLESARGGYVGFVDSDDWIAPEMYRRLYESAFGAHADIAMCDFRRDSDAEAPTGKSTAKLLDGIDCIDKIYERRSFKFKVVWNKIFKKSLFENRKFPNIRVKEDQYLLTQLYFDANRVASIDEKLYCYAHNESSITNKAFGENDMDVFELIRYREGFFRGNKLKKLYRKNLLYHFKMIKSCYFKSLKRFGKQHRFTRMIAEDFSRNYKRFASCDSFSFRNRLRLILFKIRHDLSTGHLPRRLSRSPEDR